jgi:Ca2+-binding EF-hand superfamily protein
MQISGASSQSMSASLLSKANAKIFDKLDTNKDGTVSLEEMQAGQPSSKSGSTSDTQSVSDRFTSMDTNGDGSVTEQEGLAFLTASLSSDAMGSLLDSQASAQSSGAPQPPSLEDIDSDGDGSISQSEMQNFGTTVMGDSDTTKADEIFSKMDTNQDGTVSAEEKSSFDSQMQANGPMGPPPGPPPSETASTESTSSTDSTSSSSSANIQALMKELLAALQSATGLSSTTDSTSSGSTLTATA